MKVEEKAEAEQKAREYAISKSSSSVFQEAHFRDWMSGYNYAIQPITTETLQEGDWTKCEKFSEWVSLLEIEGMKHFNSIDDFTIYKKYNGELKSTKEPMLLWGKGENFLPYQEFKQRAENTFKTK